MTNPFVYVLSDDDGVLGMCGTEHSAKDLANFYTPAIGTYHDGDDDIPFIKGVKVSAWRMEPSRPEHPWGGYTLKRTIAPVDENEKPVGSPWFQTVEEWEVQEWEAPLYEGGL